MFTLNERSERNLVGVHADLVRVVRRAAELAAIQFVVTEGKRSVEQQRRNVAKGVSKTMNSRHLTGHAVDLVPVDPMTGQVTFELLPLFAKIAQAMKAAATELRIPISWGGDWKGGWDKPHFELPWRQYPLSRQQRAELPPQVVAEAPMANGDGAYMKAGFTGGGGLGFMGDGLSRLDQAQSYFSAGGLLSIAIGTVLLGVALSMAYDKWDASGRPVPRWAPSWVRKLASTPE